MYILGRGYRGLFQDLDLLCLVPNQACGGDILAILGLLDADLPLANSQKVESSAKHGDSKLDGSGIIWDLERLGNLSLQLFGKKLIFAFDGTSTEAIRASGTFSLLNSVDPMSAAASSIRGEQCVIGYTICLVGRMPVVLALVEAAKTGNMLHMNVKDMQMCRGYHLLALFLNYRMSLFDVKSLEIFFQITACEASFSEQRNLSKFHGKISSTRSHGDMDNFSSQKDSFSHISELENSDLQVETSNCIVLSNIDMVEHVLLDWTLWVTASVPIQISLLGFLEHLLSMHRYRNRNLTILRRINLVQQLYVTLQHGDVEVSVLEKLVVLLRVTLEDGFMASELENVVKFVIMTIDPPDLKPQQQIMNMLLEMLIDLQVTIKLEALLERWHKIVSSKLITYFLDEAVHPTSMRIHVYYLSAFFEWFQNSKQIVNKVLEQCAVIMWHQTKGVEGRRKREIGWSRDISKLDLRHWEEVTEWRYALEMVRDSMSTELRVVRQDKYGWVLHAESEWQTLLQQLVHERGIFPMLGSSATEEPKMRKKLERCKLRIDTIQNVLDGQFELEVELSEGKHKDGPDASDTDSVLFLNLFTDSAEQIVADDEIYDEFFRETDDAKGVSSVNSGWNDDRAIRMNEASLHSSLEFGVKSSTVSAPMSESTQARSDLGSPRQLSSYKIDDVKVTDDKSEKELNDNGEYLIRPYLEPLEKIRFKYNCEQVVGLDKHDGIFFIGELCLYMNSVIDQALGVKKDVSGSTDFQSNSTSSSDTVVKIGGAWGKEKAWTNVNLPHPWNMWKLISVHENLKRDYQLHPVAIEIFSMDGCNDLLVLDTKISGSTKQESNEGSRLFKLMAKSFSKRWQNGEIMFAWVLADYESETLDLSNPKTFRKLDKPMGCQTPEGEGEFKKGYESWDDPEVPKFHYGSHYSSAGIVLFYLLRLPPFIMENQKLQGGQFDHADRLFNSVRDTWLSASRKGNTSDVKEVIPEFFYVGDVFLPPWAKGSAREIFRKHREALESDNVSENLHHWIDLIFGYKQRGKAAVEAVNVFYHYTYDGSVDIDSVADTAMKASILAQINHFGQTPKQVFLKPHLKRRSDRRFPPHLLKYSSHLKILVPGTNSLLEPRTHTKYVACGFPSRSLRFMSYDQDKLLSTHENFHGGNQIQCTGLSHDGQTLDGPRVLQHLQLGKVLCGHTGKITCLHVSQPYMLIVSGSDDCTVIIWDLSPLVFVRQLPEFPVPVSAIYVNDLTGEIVTAAGIMLAVRSINGDCLAVLNTSQLPSDSILSVTSCTFSDWMDTNLHVTGHQSGAVKVWQMGHCSNQESAFSKSNSNPIVGLNLGDKVPEYWLLLHKMLKSHRHPVTALYLKSDMKQLLSGDSGGHLLSWTLRDESLRTSLNHG
ncbi:hypothetical protein P3X46_003473 [Hevea brasiliensis]|uniref:BEACH domain-containing protein n=1 Tax=Hevea brasiliensis TaxID=3981 RepID=A0ABQ9N9N5_HEVBR|nr:hypothetical protein P3X46_003473 [Hevea brasiliensis]